MKQHHLSTKLQQSRLSLLLFFSLLLVAFFTKAQTNNKPVYVSFTYMKTAPGKYNDYLKLVQNYSKKLQQYQLKQGAQMGWYLYQVLMPTGTVADYNLVSVTLGTDLQQLMDPLVSARDNMQKADPQMTAQQLDSIPLLMSAARSIIKREVFLHRSGTTETGPPAKYAVIDFMTPAQGKSAEYVKMEESTFLPIHKQRIALGGLKGWRFAQKLLPSDTDDPYPYITANFYDDFDGMIDGKYEQALKKAWPAETFPKLAQQINSVKKAQKSGIWKLVEYVDQTNSK